MPQGIRNTLGKFVKISEATKIGRYTSYARICVYLNISWALTGEICLWRKDEEYIQTIDYEHIPFYCRKYHIHGNLFRDFPLNNVPKIPLSEDEKDKDNFFLVQNRKRTTHKKGGGNVGKCFTTENKFEYLTPETKDMTGKETKELEK